MIANSRLQLKYAPPPLRVRGTPQTLALSSEAPTTYDEWLRRLFPSYVAHPFAPRHTDLWAWAWAVRLGVNVPPFVACWGRGGAKSTSAELVVTRWGAARARNYVLYVCETQEQADDHIGNIAALLESPEVERHHPHLADRLVGKFGNSKGWRRNRLRVSSGFTVDALGLDTAARGVKLENMRPDAIVIDDVDGSEDSEAVTEKKRRTITRKLLPALTDDAAILFIQNKVHDHSLMARVVEGRADFLGGAIISGPHPAVEGLETAGDGASARIVAGRATWEGQNLEACQRFIEKWGLDAFLSECQHQSVGQVGRFLEHISLWDACRMPLPPLGANEPCVLALDAGESSDTFASAIISRNPLQPGGLAVRYSRAYVPDGDVLDFDAIEQDVRGLLRRYAVVEVAYDPFLLGQFMRRLALARLSVLREFPQGAARLSADKALHDRILERRIAHDGDTQLRAHLDNANVKRSAEGRQMRIVKRQKALKIDLAVAVSMGCARAAERLLTQVSVQQAPAVRGRFRDM